MSTSIETSLSREVVRLARQHATRIVEVRRYLHRHPELSEQEYETSEFLHDLCKDLGDVTYAADDLGLWVDVGGSAEDQRVAIRADIDALPIVTKLQTPYASSRPGVMHACGHDAHAAMAFGALAICRDLLDFRGQGELAPVRVIFQPAEETSAGGRHMIRSGALEDVKAAIALHVDPQLSSSTLGFRSGTLTAGCIVFECTILGKGGHSARPHLTGDTIVAASQWIQLMHQRLSRCHDSRDAIVANVGTIRGGDAPNVVPERVRMKGTIRGLSPAGIKAATKAMAGVCRSIQESYRVEVNYKEVRYTPPVINHANVIDVARVAGASIVGSENCRDIGLPSMGAEDFAFMAEQVPAAMVRIGVAGVDVGAHALHTPEFDVDESALPQGAALLALTAIELSQQSCDALDPAHPEDRR